MITALIIVYICAGVGFGLFIATTAGFASGLAGESFNPVPPIILGFLWPLLLVVLLVELLLKAVSRE